MVPSSRRPRRAYRPDLAPWVLGSTCSLGDLMCRRQQGPRALRFHSPDSPPLSLHPVPAPPAARQTRTILVGVNAREPERERENVGERG